MKNKYLILIGLGFIAFLMFLSVTESATIQTGYSFSAGETNVTHTKLNLAVNGATITGITSSEIQNGTIVADDLANNSVTSAKILDSTIVSADVMPRGFTGGEIATNGVTEIELNTNLYYRTGIHSYSNVTIAANSIIGSGVAGITNSAGVADANKIVKTGPSGKVHRSFNDVFMTNIVMVSDVTAAGTDYQTLISYSFPETTGIYHVTGQALFTGDGAAASSLLGLRLFGVEGSTTNFISEVHIRTPGTANNSDVLNIGGSIRLTGTANTIFLQGKVNVTDTDDKWTSIGADQSDASYTATNATRITVIGY